MAAGDPVPTGESINLSVPPEYAARFILDHMGLTPAKRPVVRMAIRTDDGEVDAGSWQVMAVVTERRDVGYDVSIARMRRVFDA